jgi:phosphocarrier protein
MLQREVEIINKLGLHARASARLTQVAGQFKSDVSISRNGRRVNAKSIMGVMMLAAGARIVIEATARTRPRRCRRWKRWSHCFMKAQGRIDDSGFRIQDSGFRLRTRSQESGFRLRPVIWDIRDCVPPKGA